MPKRSPPDPAADFASGLSPVQKQDWDTLVGLLKAPRSDLGWHHALGEHLAELASAFRGRSGRGWVRRLAEALGVSESRIRQHRLFAQRYTRQEVEGLQESGVGWGMVVALMGVRDQDNRRRLQQEVVAQGWSLPRLRLEIRRDHRTRRFIAYLFGR
jgi:hypothetical protein